MIRTMGFDQGVRTLLGEDDFEMKSRGLIKIPSYSSRRITRRNEHLYLYSQSLQNWIKIVIPP